MSALGLYRRRAISAGRAAALLDMEQLAFIRWTGSLGISYFDQSADELREELRTLGSR